MLEPLRLSDPEKLSVNWARDQFTILGMTKGPPTLALTVLLAE
jgi:hypothetical protein